MLRASAGQHPELFWALRGGGGNFGVVTEFQFRLHPVGLAQLGVFFWDADDGQAALTLARQVTADLSPRMGALIFGGNAPPAPFVPEQHHFRPGYGLIVAGFGAAAGHARLAGQIRSALPPLVEFTAPIPYTALQQILDEAMPRKQSPMSNLLGVPMGGPSARSRTRPPRSAAPGRHASSSTPPPSRQEGPPGPPSAFAPQSSPAVSPESTICGTHVGVCHWRWRPADQ